MYYIYMNNPTSSEKNITLKYDWTNSVDAVDLATSILNFSRAIQRIGKQNVWEWHEVKIDAYSFQEGSLDAPLLIKIVWAGIAVWQVAYNNIGTIDNVLSIIVGTIDLIKFLKGRKPSKIEPGTNPNEVIITNPEGNTGVYNAWIIHHYWDNITNNYIIQAVTPVKTNEWVSSMKINDEYGNTLTEITKADAEYFEKQESIVTSEITVLWKIYDMNTETMNGKIEILGKKVAINFKDVAYKQPFFQLSQSLTHRSTIKITGTASVDIETGDYKSITITNAIVVEQPLIETTV